MQNTTHNKRVCAWERHGYLWRRFHFHFPGHYRIRSSAFTKNCIEFKFLFLVQSSILKRQNILRVLFFKDRTTTTETEKEKRKNHLSIKTLISFSLFWLFRKFLLNGKQNNNLFFNFLYNLVSLNISITYFLKNTTTTTTITIITKESVRENDVCSDDDFIFAFLAIIIINFSYFIKNKQKAKFFISCITRFIIIRLKTTTIHSNYVIITSNTKFILFDIFL